MTSAEQWRTFTEKQKAYAREVSRIWYKKNRKRQREVIKRQLKKLRERAIERLGGKCSQCGIVDYRVLQVDHKFGGGRKEYKQLGCSGVWRRILRMKHPEKKYQALCANCNWIKYVEQKGNI